MSLAIATLSVGQKAEFYRRKAKLTSDQRECLGKMFGSIADEGHKNGDTQATIVSAMVDFITQTVLGKGSHDYCAIYKDRLAKEYG
jgi:hypothetical protein